MVIPLIIRFPEGEHGGERSALLADLVDVAPTVLDVFGFEPAPAMQGDSLLALLRGARPRRDFVLAHSINIESYALIRKGHKYITPLGLHAVSVARRHLGVFSPPNPARTDLCVRYEMGGDPDTDLCYDEKGDPLAVKDHLPHGAQLFRRDTDPAEERRV